MTDGQAPSPIVEIAVEAEAWFPREAEMRRLAQSAIGAAAHRLGNRGGVVAVLLTNDERIRDLNSRFRGKDKPTNVLSFPAAPAGLQGEFPHLGDIAIAWETARREAEAEGKAFDHHVVHLMVHGFLHLIGYDHETDREAEEMEELERQILQTLAIGDPYA